MEKISLQYQDLITKESDISIRRQCERLSINRSSIYYVPVEADRERLLLQEKLMERIDYWHTTMPYLGSRKITKLLIHEGFKVCRKTVRRLLERMSITAIYPKKNLSKRNFKEAIVPYLLRNYKVTASNQVWSIDITYIKMHHGHMYLTAIIDWYSRKIVGWNLSDTLGTAYVLEAVKDAVATYGTPKILNSDQGCQFTSKEYKEMIRNYGIKQSMDGRSRWADNIIIERWFRSLKTEKIYPNEFASPRELRKGLIDYINEYNKLRPHEALAYRTPDSYYYGQNVA